MKFDNFTEFNLLTFFIFKILFCWEQIQFKKAVFCPSELDHILEIGQLVIEYSISIS